MAGKFQWKSIMVVFMLCLLLSGCALSEPGEETQAGNMQESEESETVTETEKNAETEKDTASVELSDEDLVLITDYIPDIYIELAYATENNFVHEVLYNSNDAYLRYGTVKKLACVQQKLVAQGYSLKIWDAYRPYEVQCRLWEICPNPQYVSNPKTGKLGHCRGNTIDLTLVRLDGTEVEMPTGFDDFTKAADRDYSDVSKEAAENSQLLEDAMEEEGFKGYSGEWWHYSDSEEYPIINISRAVAERYVSAAVFFYASYVLYEKGYFWI